MPVTYSLGRAPVHALSPVMYSLFLETEINLGGEGGLLAELLPNRDFETLGRGAIPGAAAMRSAPDPREPPADPHDFRPWTLIHGAALSIDNASAPFATNPHVLRVRGGAGSGASNPGYWGIAAWLNGWFELSMYARSTRGASLDARLVQDGATLSHARIDVPASGEWQHLRATLPPTYTHTPRDAASFELVFAPGAAAASEVWLDGVSLRPSNAVGGLFRADIFQMLRGLRPGFVRMPGGNYLEGNGPRTRWDWKATLGPPAARKGHYNSAWGYWVTDAFGVYEMLILAELLGSEPQLGVYTGFSMGARCVRAASKRASATRNTPCLTGAAHCAFLMRQVRAAQRVGALRCRRGRSARLRQRRPGRLAVGRQARVDGSRGAVWSTPARDRQRGVRHGRVRILE